MTIEEFVKKIGDSTGNPTRTMETIMDMLEHYCDDKCYVLLGELQAHFQDKKRG